MGTSLGVEYTRRVAHIWNYRYIGCLIHAVSSHECAFALARTNSLNAWEPALEFSQGFACSGYSLLFSRRMALLPK